MGREVRRVPANWEHPTDGDGDFIPLFDGTFTKDAAEWDEGKRQWDRGFRDDWKGGWQVKSEEEKGYTFEEWHGTRPESKDYMPEWPDAERTHLMMYETCTEGTPISPVMPTPEDLARWLADNSASAFGDMTASYEAWLSTIRAGSAPSGIISPGKGIQSGVQGQHEIHKENLEKN